MMAPGAELGYISPWMSVYITERCHYVLIVTKAKLMNIFQN